MYRLHNLWMIICTIYRAKYIIWTISHHGIHNSHWDIDVTWMDINMDINICMKASYFGSSDLTVKCIQSKKKYLHVEVMFCLNWSLYGLTASTKVQIHKEWSSSTENENHKLLIRMFLQSPLLVWNSFF